jgi:hypothetical protein
MNQTMTNTPPSSKTLGPLFEAVAKRAKESGVFGAVEIGPRGVVCDAKASAAPAQYRITAEDGKLYAEVTTADRWLSHSIEADLLNTGDSLGELIDEELVELGALPLHAPPANPKVDHFRNDAKLFVFRSLIPSATAARPAEVALVLLAYEACFAKLGDMSAGESDD